MSESVPIRGPMSVEEYLRFENAAQTKHEYVAGDVYAMEGGSMRHARIISNIVGGLLPVARGGRCQVVWSVKCRTPDDRFYYPDVMVVCTAGRDTDTVRRDPCLVVEVTSPSTARIDRGEKLDAYRTIPSLQAYLIVDHRSRRVERHWRDRRGGWQRAEITGSGSVPVPCPELDLTLDEIYEGVQLVVGEPEPAAYG
jgi:Uma2 family endonuclease